MTMTTISEIDEFSTLFDDADGYDDDIFESFCSKDVPASTSIPQPNNTDPGVKGLLKVPSIESCNTASVKSRPTHPAVSMNMFPFMVNGFEFQPSTVTTHFANPISVRKRKGGIQDAEERRMKNREAADKSRLKKRMLLDTLPAMNAELEAKVRTLECSLAASKAEAQTLREQCNFLKTLLNNKHENFTANHTGVSVSPDYEPSLVPHTTQGVLLLAVCCILTVNQWGCILDPYPDSEVLHNGGRILLSTKEDSEYSLFDEKSLSGSYLCMLLFFGLFCFAQPWSVIRRAFRYVTASPCLHSLPQSNRCRISLFKSHGS